MKRVVIESPYSSGTVVSIPAVVARNVRYLRACMRDSVLRGESPYASHGLLTQEGVLDDTIPEERTRGIEAGFAWREVADLTVFYVDLGWSGGMKFGKVHTEGSGGAYEERRLEGEWSVCRMFCPGGEGSEHLYSCPMWRAS